MRHYDRFRAPVPAILDSSRAHHFRAELTHYLTLPDVERRQRRPPVDYALLKGLKPALIDLFGGCCAYCESPVSSQSFGDIEQHRPKGNAADKEGHTSLEHYAWLAYEWHNLLLACQICNASKRNQFWVIGERAPIGTPIFAIREVEEALLLDPCFDAPASHISFLSGGTAEALSPRGEATIAMLNLNRYPLVYSRQNAFRQIIKLLQFAPEQVATIDTGAPESAGRFIFADVPYAGAVTSMALHHFRKFWQGDDLPGLLQALTRTSREQRLALFTEPDAGLEFEAAISPTKPKPARRSRVPDIRRMPSIHDRIAKIVIKNYRALELIEFELPPAVDDQLTPCMIILGENATGKSSVLEAIVLALLGTVEAGELNALVRGEDISPDGVIRRLDPGDWAIKASGGMSIGLEFHSDNPRVELKGHGDDKTFGGMLAQSKIVLAYGPRRYFPTSLTRRFRPPVYRVVSLFDPLATIPNPEHWLLDCDRPVFDAAVRALREILMLERDGKISRDNGQILIETSGGSARLKELSVGYKSILALSVDVMRELMQHFDNLEEASAVVLIDEIEAHLHPRWKMRIMSLLRRAMPKVQFIVTTHDPLCLRGMYDGEVFVLHRGADRKVQRVTDLPNVRGMRAEQLLTSEFFGLGSTDPETEAKLSLYAGLLARRDTLSKEEEEELANVRETLTKELMIGDTLPHQAMAQALGRFVEASRAEPIGPVFPSRRQIIDDVLAALDHAAAENSGEM